MDVNGDDLIDIVSGSYSHSEPSVDMAGYFQVLLGEKGGKWKAAQVLRGNDEKPLLLSSGSKEQADVAKICTRAFVADLDDDGNLDLVSGNFGGTFGWFRGEDSGGFAPESTWLQAAGAQMQVQLHSDPFLVDWDGDGDLDLLSGSATGGAFLFTNIGSKAEPKFAAMQTLVEPVAGHQGVIIEGETDATETPVTFGDAHLVGPNSSTRVWADDVDGDGTLDLLVGDSITVQHVLEGKSEAETRVALLAWEKKFQELMERMQSNAGGAPDAALNDEWQKHYQSKKELVREEMTGFVWFYKGKAKGDGAKRTASN
ncbi:MAG: hypothetical protein FJ293_05230 [Planctomycetes bacterium]|nr:hypothetical protein [Planctomycetota bacterium]